jgi:Protein of unknown function (DUF3147)
MNIGFNPSAVKSSSLGDHLMRFSLGGAITAVAALIAARYGPVIGGLFLAFPAIFPAGVTLVAKREKLKKQRAGYDGANRGRLAAALDARGACLGCLGLLAFAAVVWQMLPAHSLALTLILATLAWSCISVLLWWLEHLLPKWRVVHARNRRARNNEMTT